MCWCWRETGLAQPSKEGMLMKYKWWALGLRLAHIPYILCPSGQALFMQFKEHKAFPWKHEVSHYSARNIWCRGGPPCLLIQPKSLWPESLLSCKKANLTAPLSVRSAYQQRNSVLSSCFLCIFVDDKLSFHSVKNYASGTCRRKRLVGFNHSSTQLVYFWNTNVQSACIVPW